MCFIYRKHHLYGINSTSAIRFYACKQAARATFNYNDSMRNFRSLNETLSSDHSNGLVLCGSSFEEGTNQTDKYYGGSPIHLNVIHVQCSIWKGWKRNDIRNLQLFVVLLYRSRSLSVSFSCSMMMKLLSQINWICAVFVFSSINAWLFWCWHKRFYKAKLLIMQLHREP